MKELLQERLENLQQAVEKKRQEMTQANADMNVLIGHATECANTIAMVEAQEKEAAEKVASNEDAARCASPMCEAS